MTWDEEIAAIRKAAALRGVDWAFIAAIRKAENGGPGREWGVLSEDATTYQAQLTACCASVRNRLNDYPANPVCKVERADLPPRVAYREGFIDYFARRWAPVGASNDPEGLNANWVKNVEAIYAELVASDA